MAYNWISIMGQFVHEDETIVFKGGRLTTLDGHPLYHVGNYICDQNFSGGKISAEVEFVSSVQDAACEFIIVYYPPAQAFTTAGLGSGGLCAIRTWTGSQGNQWITHAATGEKSQLLPNHSYNLSVLVRGSRAKVTIDGVDVIDTTIPFALPRGQAGIWCMGDSDIKISHYKISPERPKIFVVMQFTPPYNELYGDVIVPVCNELDLTPLRADEAYGPGLIVADIAREIIESKIIIADITPANPNVYYEVGYAHALKKPTILIAEKPT
jgi:hypothetical protein